MTDISGLEDLWNKEVNSIQQDIYKYNGALQKVENFHDKYDAPHGRFRLYKPFVMATRIAPARRKEMKIKNDIDAEKSELKNFAANTLSNLADAVARDSSAQSTQFIYLETAIKEIQNAQDKVNKAAKKCRNASTIETGASIGDAVSEGISIENNISFDSNNSDDATAQIIAIVAAQCVHIFANIGASMAARKATSAFRAAAQDVQSLQKTLQEEMPRVNGAIADDISSSNGSALMMGTFSDILGTLSNLQMAGKLSDAKDHLHGVAKQLGGTIDKLSQDKRVLADAALTEARKTDGAVEKFAATLENYIISGKLPTELENDKLFLDLPTGLENNILLPELPALPKNPNPGLGL